MYKTKLQELCQKRKWKLPEYTSSREGEDHNPLFSASVWVHGTSFDSGPASKSSKQAHNQAAQLAFLHFTSGCSGSMSQEGSESAERTSSEEQIQSFIYPEDNMAIINKSSGEIFGGAEANSKKLTDYEKKTLAHYGYGYGYGAGGFLKLAPSSRLKNEAQTNQITGEKDKVRHEEEEKGTEMKSYLLCNRFKLFTSIPNMVLPRGTVLLPISENMWTLVALEFPNE